MNKRFLTCVSAGILCLVAMPVLADCVCGTTGCKPCDDTEDYLEDVGEHMKKQSKRLNKKMKQSKMSDMDCGANQPSYWMEEAELLDANGNVVLYYAELVEDDTFVLTPAQKEKAKSDAMMLKQAGQKLKDKASTARQSCEEVVTVAEEEVVNTAPDAMKKKMKSDKKSQKMHKKYRTGQPQFMWVDEMESNGNMLIDVGDFIGTNMTK